MSTSDLAWFKSSYSGSQGDDCVEVAKGTPGDPRAGLQGPAEPRTRPLPHRVERLRRLRRPGLTFTPAPDPSGAGRCTSPGRRRPLSLGDGILKPR